MPERADTNAVVADVEAAAMPPIDAERLWARVQTLAQFTRPDEPFTRRAFSPLFAKSREWLRAEFEAAGLAVRLDEAGNLIGRRCGRAQRRDRDAGAGPGPGSGDAHAPAIVTGSHCDTVVGGGRFDGIIGVLAGIEVARAMHEHGVELEHAFEVIDFLSEEPSDYGISCVGSRGMAGLLDADMLAASDAHGETLAQALQRIGARPEALGAPLRGPGEIAAFVELHIEQGPVLEDTGVPIGVVTDIVGIRRVAIDVIGRPDHAGTTPMQIRCDALVGAARIIDAAQRRALQAGAGPHYVVATVGRIAMTPNVPNAVPGRVEMVLEVRSDAPAVLDEFPETLLAAVQDDLQRLRLTVQMRPLSRSTPTACAPLVMDAVARAAAALDYPAMRLPSGAGHDAAYVAALAPVGMIFIPCLNGRSHCSEEWIEPAQLLDGTRVLYRTVLELDRVTPPPGHTA